MNWIIVVVQLLLSDYHLFLTWLLLLLLLLLLRGLDARLYFYNFWGCVRGRFERAEVTHRRRVEEGHPRARVVLEDLRDEPRDVLGRRLADVALEESAEGPRDAVHAGHDRGPYEALYDLRKVFVRLEHEQCFVFVECRDDRQEPCKAKPVLVARYPHEALVVCPDEFCQRYGPCVSKVILGHIKRPQ